jgi:hypothetical protein
MAASRKRPGASLPACGRRIANPPQVVNLPHRNSPRQQEFSTTIWASRFGGFAPYLMGGPRRMKAGGHGKLYFCP